ncbi:MAG: NAD-dependent dehydratase [Herminiimonas sp.]|nr:NAD-dependent dehydratase [Herminiimonas sp.]
MAYSSVLVIGGAGFIGSHLVAQLAASGRDITVPTRRYERARHLLVLPTVEVVEADVHDDAALHGLLQKADAVINLAGVLHSRAGRPGSAYGPDFAVAHVDLPGRIVAGCAANGVRRYLHMSALGAHADAPSMYLRSKAAGEAVALSHPAVAATVFRPSVVFGEEDRFLNLFASLQKFLPVMLLGGADAKFQPVYVGDVARAFVNTLENPHAAGSIFELAGPRVYSLRELVKLAGAYSGHPRPVIGLPAPLARLQAFMLEHMPGGPLMSRDNLDSMKIDNVASGPPAPELGITPTPLEAVAPHYLAS